MHVTSHKGDVCFPGGKLDETDADEVEASLREAEEEIGLHREQIQVLAVLPPVISAHGYQLNPTVAFIPGDFVPQPNHDEVESVFSLPLKRFLSSHNMTKYGYGEKGIYYYVPLFKDKVTDTGQEYTTWGLTAYVCIQVAVILFEKEPDFEMAKGIKIDHEDPFWLTLWQLEARKSRNNSPSKL